MCCNPLTISVIIYWCQCFFFLAESQNKAQHGRCNFSSVKKRRGSHLSPPAGYTLAYASSVCFHLLHRGALLTQHVIHEVPQALPDSKWEQVNAGIIPRRRFNKWGVGDGSTVRHTWAVWFELIKTESCWFIWSHITTIIWMCHKLLIFQSFIFPA